MIRVLIVDDDRSMCQLLGLLVEWQADLKLVGTASDGQVAMDQVQRMRPDVVTMDLQMPRLDGLMATQRIRAMPGAPPILIVSNPCDDETVQLALTNGARGFVAKPDVLLELASAIREVSRGQSYFSRTLSNWRSRRIMAERETDLLGRAGDRSIHEMHLAFEVAGKTCAVNIALVSEVVGM